MEIYSFPLSGLEEVPPNASPATGFATVTLDTATNFLSWTIEYSGMVGTTTAAHFHGAAPPGVNAGVRLDIPSNSGGNLLSPINGSAFISAAHAQEVLDGLWYINIHSTVFPGGEIRGQVVPTPGALALAGVAGLAAFRRRRA